MNADSYKTQIIQQINKHISQTVDTNSLTGYLKQRYDSLLNDSGMASEGLLTLTELVYEITGKRSYILIDEYDKLLMDNYSTDKYDEIREFETAMLSAGLKGNMIATGARAGLWI